MNANRPLEDSEKERLFTLREESLKGYKIRNGRIADPGKFEGEPVFAPYFYGLAMEGFSDEDDGEAFIFRFVKGDPELEVWPELKRYLEKARTLKLRVDGQGFVGVYRGADS